jgi:hypothetical protein
MYEETLTVLSFSINPVDDDENKIQSIDLQLCMPAEVDLFGILYVDQYKQDIPNVFKVKLKYHKILFQLLSY